MEKYDPITVAKLEALRGDDSYQKVADEISRVSEIRFSKALVWKAIKEGKLSRTLEIAFAVYEKVKPLRERIRQLEEENERLRKGAIV